MTDGDMMDGMWDMMGDMDGMHGMMGGGGPETTGSASGQGEVAIEDFRFEPTVLNVTTGTVVNWTNEDSAPHTATGDGFDTGRLDKGEAREITFGETGTSSTFARITRRWKDALSSVRSDSNARFWPIPAASPGLSHRPFVTQTTGGLALPTEGGDGPNVERRSIRPGLRNRPSTVGPDNQ